MQTRQELLTGLQDEYDRWEKLLAGLDEQRIVARDLPAGLSVKDVVAHLWAWQQLSVARLQAALTKTEPPAHLGPEHLDPDLEKNLEPINAWMHETNLGRAWSEVHRDWSEGFLRFIDLSKTIPEADLLQPGKYSWLHGDALAAVLEGSFEHHHDEHLEPLLEWLRNHDHAADLP